eukprot:TRINITY_DN1881_c0_g1_i4.p1 TRINITY_DN1881_c0_g1~~TRINITY_DN1881_c0_g1_i4.p1  ORF type:complete len:1943 (-),score=430.54 TRINITY_DN1881_c0_g1_i4:231-6059(-)
MDLTRRLDHSVSTVLPACDAKSNLDTRNASLTDPRPLSTAGSKQLPTRATHTSDQSSAGVPRHARPAKVGKNERKRARRHSLERTIITPIEHVSGGTCVPSKDGVVPSTVGVGAESAGKSSPVTQAPPSSDDADENSTSLTVPTGTSCHETQDSAAPSPRPLQGAKELGAFVSLVMQSNMWNFSLNPNRILDEHIDPNTPLGVAIKELDDAHINGEDELLALARISHTSAHAIANATTDLRDCMFSVARRLGIHDKIETIDFINKHVDQKFRGLHPAGPADLITGNVNSDVPLVAGVAIWETKASLSDHARNYGISQARMWKTIKSGTLTGLEVDESQGPIQPQAQGLDAHYLAARFKRAPKNKKNPIVQPDQFIGQRWTIDVHHAKDQFDGNNYILPAVSHDMNEDADTLCFNHSYTFRHMTDLPDVLKKMHYEFKQMKHLRNHNKKCRVIERAERANDPNAEPLGWIANEALDIKPELVRQDNCSVLNSEICLRIHSDNDVIVISGVSGQSWMQGKAEQRLYRGIVGAVAALGQADLGNEFFLAGQRNYHCKLNYLVSGSSLISPYEYFLLEKTDGRYERPFASIAYAANPQNRKLAKSLPGMNIVIRLLKFHSFQVGTRVTLLVYNAKTGHVYKTCDVAHSKGIHYGGDLFRAHGFDKHGKTITDFDDYATRIQPEQVEKMKYQAYAHLCEHARLTMLPYVTGASRGSKTRLTLVPEGMAPLGDSAVTIDDDGDETPCSYAPSGGQVTRSPDRYMPNHTIADAISNDTKQVPSEEGVEFEVHATDTDASTSANDIGVEPEVDATAADVPGDVIGTAGQGWTQSHALAALDTSISADVSSTKVDATTQVFSSSTDVRISSGGSCINNDTNVGGAEPPVRNSPNSALGPGTGENGHTLTRSRLSTADAASAALEVEGSDDECQSLDNSELSAAVDDLEDEGTLWMNASTIAEVITMVNDDLPHDGFDEDFLDDLPQMIDDSDDDDDEEHTTSPLIADLDGCPGLLDGSSSDDDDSDDGFFDDVPINNTLNNVPSLVSDSESDSEEYDDHEEHATSPLIADLNVCPPELLDGSSSDEDITEGALDDLRHILIDSDEERDTPLHATDTPSEATATNAGTPLHADAPTGATTSSATEPALLHPHAATNVDPLSYDQPSKHTLKLIDRVNTRPTRPRNRPSRYNVQNVREALEAGQDASDRLQLHRKLMKQQGLNVKKLLRSYWDENFPNFAAAVLPEEVVDTDQKEQHRFLNELTPEQSKELTTLLCKQMPTRPLGPPIDLSKYSLEDIAVPRNLYELVKHPEKFGVFHTHWLMALWDEFDGIAARDGIRQLSPEERAILENDHGAIATHLGTVVFKTKVAVDGITPTRLKARFCCRGDLQKTFDVENVFSPTPDSVYFRIMLHLHATTGIPLRQMDVIQAFIASSLKTHVPIETPFLYRRNIGRVVVLMKGLYGLREASKLWQDLLSAYLLETGWRRSSEDSCSFLRTHQGVQQVLLTYVDDLLLLSPTNLADEFFADIEKTFDVKDLGAPEMFLGMTVHHASEGVYVCQESLARDVIRKMDLKETDKRDLPLPATFIPTSKDGPRHAHEADIKRRDLSIDDHPYVASPADMKRRELYLSVVGCILYLTMTRVDVLTSISILAAFNSDPGATHMDALRHLACYINNDTRVGLFFSRDSSNELIAYSDANYGGCLDTRRSRRGGVIFLGSNLIFAASKLMGPIALSSCESEFMAVFELAKFIISFKRALQELGIIDDEPVPILCDNQSTVLIANGSAGVRNIRHMSLRFHALRQWCNDGIVKPLWIPGGQQLADIMTKTQGRILFLEQRNHLVRSVPQQIVTLNSNTTSSTSDSSIISSTTSSTSDSNIISSPSSIDDINSFDVIVSEDDNDVSWMIELPILHFVHFAQDEDEDEVQNEDQDVDFMSSLPCLVWSDDDDDVSFV